VTTAPVLVPAPVRSVPVADPGSLVARLPPAGALSWVRGGDGLVAWGEFARVQVRGPDRFAAALAWWEALCSSLSVDDAVGVPGTGPVAFGSFSFDPAGSSVLVVPRTVLGRRAGRAWLTTLGPAGGPFGVPRRSRPTRPGGVRYAEGALSVTAWQAAVAEAVRRIHHGEAEKVVLARDLLAYADQPVDVRYLLTRLAERYPQCWTFCCDGLVGATPELLVRRVGDSVTSRVLAGTARRRGDAAADLALAASLLSSAKNLEEHRLAVRSVADVLAAHCTELVIPEAPQVLRLANVQHLATDLSARLVDRTTSLELAGSLHPTAAVCGTPRDRALAVIAELEGFDRGRYAGPVGWLDATGDGEWGIALRCAEVADSRLRLFAGCGLVGGSDPDAELAEYQAKLVAMRDALEG
jgi:menaquinone-specific isochorismate synthase